MASVKEIPQVSPNTLEIPNLPKLWRQRGVPTAEEEALSGSGALDDIIQSYIEDPLNKRNHPMAAYVAGNEARLMALLAPFMFGGGEVPESVPTNLTEKLSALKENFAKGPATTTLTRDAGGTDFLGPLQTNRLRPTDVFDTRLWHGVSVDQPVPQWHKLHSIQNTGVKEGLFSRYPHPGFGPWVGVRAEEMPPLATRQGGLAHVDPDVEFQPNYFGNTRTKTPIDPNKLTVMDTTIASEKPPNVARTYDPLHPNVRKLHETKALGYWGAKENLEEILGQDVGAHGNRLTPKEWEDIGKKHRTFAEFLRGYGAGKSVKYTGTRWAGAAGGPSEATMNLFGKYLTQMNPQFTSLDKLDQEEAIRMFNNNEPTLKVNAFIDSKAKK